ncbi:MAG: hypothetical protein ACREPV_09000 [Lysobacter sp.]
MSHPNCHLLFEVDGLGGRTRALVDALLRVDLGARVKLDATTGEVDVEGWFRKEDVSAAVLDLGYRLIRMEERPPSPATTRSLRNRGS